MSVTNWQCRFFPRLDGTLIVPADHFSLFFGLIQSRCEAILRTQPSARFAKELHLAAMEAGEQKQQEQIKQAAVGSVVAAVAIGVIGGLAGLLLKRR